ncbi:hypothetical protein [Paenibacillus odorifer]|uniref:hypothetical protein n=1 Tax=Paenibacillus TaxID=44249 RepID=UPI001C4DC919|nr:hypothetical protein [Paenibacillus odorifer]
MGINDIISIWYFLMAGTSAVVNVVSVNKRRIVIQNMSGQNTVTIPKGIYKLIDVNEEYFISYNSRIGQKPFLTSIEPSAK